MNKKNTTVISAIVVVLIVIIGGFGWHQHKQKTELNGEWVNIREKNDAFNMAFPDKVDMYLLNIKNNKFKFKSHIAYQKGKPYDDGVGLYAHGGKIELNNKDKEVTFIHSKESENAGKYKTTGHYTLSKDKNYLTIEFPEDSEIADHLAGHTRGHAVFVRKGSHQYNKLYKKALKYAKTHH